MRLSGSGSDINSPLMDNNQYILILDSGMNVAQIEMIKKRTVNNKCETHFIPQ